MEKARQFLTKGYHPFVVLGFIAALIFLYLTVAMLLLKNSWIVHALRITAIMFAISMGIQIARVKREKVTLLDILRFCEHSLLDITHMVKSIFYHLNQFRRLIILLVLIYVAEAGAAAWALQQWGSKLSDATQTTILGTLHVVYTTTVPIVWILGSMLLIWFFIKVAISKHFSNHEDLVEKILKGLEDEGVKVTYSHTSNGRCHLNVHNLLDVLGNNNVKTPAHSELYWLIKNNIDLLQRVEFFPHGKPKTPIQRLAESLEQGNLQEQH